MKKIRHFNDTSLPVKIVRMDSQTPIGMHEHDFHELVMVFGGEGIHFTKNNKYKIGAGDVFLIKPGTSHGYENTNDLELVNLLYFPEKLNLMLYDLADVPGYYAFFKLEPAMRRQHGFKSRLKLNSSKIIYLKQLIKYIEEELNLNKGGVLFTVSSYLMQIMVYISRSFTESEQPMQMDIIKLSNVLSYMETNYQHNITLAELTKRAAMSESTLYRMFYKVFNMSPINYLISLRVDKACELLDNSELPISEIAGECGFPDSNYFSRTFKKITDMTPRQYRQR